MKMKRSRSVLSAFLACVLASTMCGIPAYADENAGSASMQGTVTGESEAGSDESSGGSSADGSDGFQSDDPSDKDAASDGNGKEPGEDLDASGEDATQPITEDEFVADEPAPSLKPAGERSLRVIVMQGAFPAAPITTNISIMSKSTSEAASESISVSAVVGMDARQGSAVFRGLADGAYVVTVKAQGFANYTQEVAISGSDVSITVSTSYVEPADGDVSWPGIMLYGDIMGDGAVGDSDVRALVEAIEYGPPSGDDSRFNLYDSEGEDGAIDLVDLQVLAESIQRLQDKEANPEKYASTLTGLTSLSAISLNKNSSVKPINGSSIEDLLNSTLEHSVQLAAGNGEAISEQNPIKVEFDFAEGTSVAGTVITTPMDSGNAISEGYVDVEGDNYAATFKIGKQLGEQSQAASLGIIRSLATLRDLPGEDAAGESVPEKRGNPSGVSINDDGSIVIDFQGKIAIKKVTIRITAATSPNATLAEITSVEFLNNMAERIAPPEMNVPKNLRATPDSEQFSVAWDAEHNITGYMLRISHDGKEDFLRTTKTTAEVTKFAGGKIVNGTTFQVCVQSMNGDWRSGWSDPIEVTPMATKPPDAPEQLRVSEGLRSLGVSWKAMKNTDYYQLFYREKTSASEAEAPYAIVDGISVNSYQITGLKDNTEYQIFVVGVNAIGASPRSASASGRTITAEPAQLPAYKLLNTQADDGTYLTGIASASYVPEGGDHARSMVGSTLDAPGSNTALGMFDDNYDSYYQRTDWDDGAAYPGGNNAKGVTVQFSSEQTIGFISLARPVDDFGFVGVRIKYVSGTNSNGSDMWSEASAGIYRYVGDNGRAYYIVKLGEPITTSKVNVCLRNYNSGTISIAEMRFHGYDSLESDIMALYADDLHIELAEGVTTNTIMRLKARLDQPDEASGEYHPFRASLQAELDYATKLLNQDSLDDVIQIHTDISAGYDSSSLGVGGLNAWQPLGAVAGTDDNLVVYVGAKGVTSGSWAGVQLVISQYHPEASEVGTAAYSLRVGRNEIPVPKMTSKEVERGGHLYVQYIGSNKNDIRAVRVAGAESIPVLDLYQVSDPAEREQKVAAYVGKLAEHVDALESLHEEKHIGSTNRNLHYVYDETNCILNATDIMLDQMMYSVPASQILAGCSRDAARLLNAFDSMDEMMELFYQHKGLATSSVEGVTAANLVPSRHLNVRYCRMFAGAFMYAAGNHIGIGYGSCSGLCQQAPVIDEAGNKVSGTYFGWGLTHEIGHNINDGRYAYAEVTNNYFAQLARAYGEDSYIRFKYDDVYDRVTSGEQGRTRSVFVQLAMYWQLRLAYDKSNPFMIHETYSDIANGYFFARVDAYARTPSSAPMAEGDAGVALTLDGGESQNIVRLASAAAERDLTDFFARWGITADATTAKYAGQFPKEDRAIYYVNDDARDYARSHTDSGLVSGKDVASATAAAEAGRVTLAMSADSSVGDSLLGYEITRVTTASGKAQRQVVGFTTDGSFTDDASILGNRAVGYEVVAIDKFLNRSAVCTVDPIKLDGDGYISKKGWVAQTNMTSPDDVDQTQQENANEEDPDNPLVISAIDRTIDSDADSVYTGSVAMSSELDPFIEIDMKQVREVTSVRYTAGDAANAIDRWRVNVSIDGSIYTTVGEGMFALDDNGSQMLYFDNGEDPWICTYNARYVRLVAVGQKGRMLSAGEIDIYGPSGDNVDFLSGEGVDAIGRLSEAFEYQPASGDMPALSIPAGSVVFIGSYKGNPAYNMVVLYDSDGNIVGGTAPNGDLVAQQIILAPDISDSAAMLGETSEGRWVYWIEPDTQGDLPALPAKVRAELYRTDNALTNQGQRLVSDSLFAAVPSTLPGITISAAPTGRQYSAEVDITDAGHPSV